MRLLGRDPSSLGKLGLELLIRRRKRGSKRRISQPQQHLTFIFRLFSLEAAAHLM
jgi:hypothetical protein